uniref:C2H2-type domain-containing protein n=1 Tax=Megaselia scalaris TaxID=36166 RepID=T1GAE1_MEGSC
MSRKLNPKLKPNPASVIKQPLKKILLNNNVVPVAVNKQPQRISITQMSDMLLDFYKTNNAAKAPKNEPIRQTSPSSADGAESQNTNENKCPKEMKSKNINNNYSVSKKQSKVSVIQPPMMNNSTPVAAFAAALFRDGYNNFQNQLRAQEILKGQQQRQQQARLPEPAGKSKKNNGTIGTSDEEGQFTEGDDDSKYSGFDDIHLIEGSKTMHYGSNSNDYMSDESQHKFLLANNLKNLEFSLGGGPAGAQHYTNLAMAGDEPMYECRHCGKRYRWKSTLRRHENVECGGKEPSHQCPYCPYKSKQRGNLGVHVRKHHSNMPQLQSKRRSKYSVKLEDNNITI